MPYTPTVTREQFRAAIDKALLEVRTEIGNHAWINLRRIGVQAEHFATGSYTNCPATQAGLEVYDPGVMRFAHAFDDALDVTSGGKTSGYSGPVDVIG